MQADVLELMTELFLTRGIHVIPVPRLREIDGRIDYNLRKQLFRHFEYRDYLDTLCKDLSPGTLHHIEDDFRLFFSVLCFPEEAPEHGGQYLFIGPVRFQPMSSREFQEIVEEKQIHPDLYRELTEFYNRIPLWGSFDSYVASLAIFCSRLSGRDINTRTHLHGEHFTPEGASEYASPAHTELSRSTIEARYEAESRFMDAVAAGNLEKALSAFSEIRHYKLSARTPDLLRNTKNLYVILNTLLRKAAQQGQVHPIYIDDLSRQLAIQIESAVSLALMESLPAVMIRKYCLLVRNHSRGACSSLVRFCLDYIDFHYMEDVSLSLLADSCSVTASYLSSAFSKEIGMTITDYILQTRINRALALLNTTTLSIQEIASSCGFSDPNYFTRSFKKLKGQSPRQYREAIRNTQPL